MVHSGLNFTIQTLKTNYQTADRPGFEPGAQGYPCVGLANRWFQPLTHLSNWGRKDIETLLFFQSLPKRFFKFFSKGTRTHQTHIGAGALYASFYPPKVIKTRVFEVRPLPQHHKSARVLFTGPGQNFYKIKSVGQVVG